MPPRSAAACIIILAALACRAPAHAAPTPSAKAAAGSHTTGTTGATLDLTPPDDSTDFLNGVTGALNTSYDTYLALKNTVQTTLNIQYALQVSLTAQWATPHGGPAVAGVTYSPWLTWTPFANTDAGTGTFTYSSLQDQFWTHADTNAQQVRLGVLSPPNDWGANANQYSQLTYTQTLPGNWLALSIGQYSFAQYDGNQYAGNAQTNFLNYALAQNGTQTYANAGIGFYGQLNPTGTLQFAGGAQGASNIAGAGFNTGGMFGGRTAWFAAAQYTPQMLAGGTYALLIYNQPAVPQQPTPSHGISFSAVQNLTAAYGIFLRANTASGNAIAIEDSLSAGAVLNNPLGRNPLDQAGLALAFDSANQAALNHAARRPEWLTEAYYNFTVFKAMQLSPDLQTYLNLALPHSACVGAVISLRGIFRF